MLLYDAHHNYACQRNLSVHCSSSKVSSLWLRGGCVESTMGWKAGDMSAGHLFHDADPLPNSAGREST